MRSLSELKQALLFGRIEELNSLVMEALDALQALEIEGERMRQGLLSVIARAQNPAMTTGNMCAQLEELLSCPTLLRLVGASQAGK